MIRQLKLDADRDILIGGPELAAQAFQAGLIDECQIFLHPILVQGGKFALPDNILQNLELAEEHRFDTGTVFLRYKSR